MKDLKQVLLAITGNDQTIIPRSFYHLSIQKNLEIGNIYIITTKSGSKTLKEGNRANGIPILLGEQGILHQLCAEYSIETPGVEIIVMKDNKGNEIVDLNRSERIAFAADFIFAQVQELMENGNAFHYVSSDKEISKWLSSIISILGREWDKFYTLSIEPCNLLDYPEFCYLQKSSKGIKAIKEILKDDISIDDIKLELTEIPILKLGGRYGSFLDSKSTFKEAVDRIRYTISLDKPHVYSIRKTDAKKKKTHVKARSNARDVRSDKIIRSVRKTRGLPRKLLTLDESAVSNFHLIEHKKHKNSGIIGQDKSLIKALDDLVKYTKHKRTILLYGKTGTGKELFAEYSNRINNAPGNFVKVNCHSVPENMIESAFFGHEKGAFTGATSKHDGYLKRADNGTIFMDEVNKKSIYFQAKFLRFLDNGEIQPVGGEKTEKVNVRVILGMNQNPEELVSSGELREDFYYRIKGFSITIPSLRERIDDIKLLAEYFAILKSKNEFSNKIKSVSNDVIDKLKQHYWPGNVRELRYTILKAVMEAEDDETVLKRLPEDFENELKLQKKKGGTFIPREIVSKSKLTELTYEDIKNRFDEETREYLKFMLEKYNYNKKLTANKIGIPQSTFKDKLNELGI